MRVFSSLMLASALAMAPMSAVLAQEASVVVNGEGFVDVAPDIATINLGVTTTADSAAAAMAANSEAVNAVMERLAASGVAASDIQTANLSLGPDYSSYDSSTGGAPSRYVASNYVNVQVRDLAKLGEILDSAIADGANTLNGITFGLADPRPAQDKARAAAVADAQAKATLLAQAAGVALGPVTAVVEAGGYVNPTPMFKREASDAAVPVAGGELSVQANVTVTFGKVE
ncbi:SIMPL domain-containing protein [Neogemmobacter tilapiae]|uniref:DUF541 domain-containing protein n=1 Tax=Neogemmobacter tilapiae TaxID=875041 RepID=A0A918U240_9RHOB|nr:SIMPL domain-containing protein [Gemmobacter tilapiae]GHC66950.1 hypothetical protein GCM10007315_34840 [Gemmobacter tilapiae]